MDLNKRTLKIDTSLQKIINIVNDSNLEYWIDSGTLLGIIRNGKIFDNDIDISAIYDAKNVLILIKKLKEHGFFVRTRYAGKIPYSLEIKYKKKINSDIDIDLKFFKKYKNYTISPTVYSLNSFRNKFSILLHNTIKFPFSVLLRILSTSRTYTNLFHFLFSGKAVWVIPTQYIQKTKKLGGTNISVPYMHREYLAYRYGDDWMTPNSNWDYVKDDGGFVLRELNEFLKAKRIKC